MHFVMMKLRNGYRSKQLTLRHKFSRQDFWSHLVLPVNTDINEMHLCHAQNFLTVRFCRVAVSNLSNQKTKTVFGRISDNSPEQVTVRQCHYAV